ncbi:saccharopine dehydrogenase family protein [uncultured Jatrophihabitans sp.]|uniref:saccharopine dehydrogenase family protein n=1 Tax=uncultured Jatrophihabitans sp. TaxID=1610747 RepID=UPI0035CCA24F
MPAAGSRDHDIVLLGATGFAGELTAAYLAAHAPADCRLALAGRDKDKLAAVRDRLPATVNGIGQREITLLSADTDDTASLRTLATSARVLATTVGPYALYGDGVVAACAAAGTDYLDLTGEPEFVDTSWLRHHETAVSSGARLVHAAGFDSIPHDLGVLFTVLQLPPDGPITITGYVSASGAASGGTFASALTAFGRPRQNIAAARARRAREAASIESGERRSRSSLGRPHRAPDGGWAVPLPTVDPQVVARSGRALARYGPDFRYSHFAVVPRLPLALGGVAGVGALALAAQVPPARRALQRRLAPGQGPSAERRAKSWFAVTFVGEAGADRVRTRVSGGDPGYDETAKMLGESALSLAFDDLPDTSGQVTTAAAMGEALIDRLRAAGMSFEVLNLTAPVVVRRPR